MRMMIIITCINARNLSVKYRKNKVFPPLAAYSYFHLNNLTVQETIDLMIAEIKYINLNESCTWSVTLVIKNSVREISLVRQKWRSKSRRRLRRKYISPWLSVSRHDKSYSSIVISTYIIAREFSFSGRPWRTLRALFPGNPVPTRFALLTLRTFRSRYPNITLITLRTGRTLQSSLPWRSCRTLKSSC